MTGCPDETLYEVCCREERCLVTLDLDFSDIVRFPPSETSGIVIVRMPRGMTFAGLSAIVQRFLSAVDKLPIQSNLLVLETNRIRIHEANG